ncbi:hypothetical protein PWP93_20330 [Paraburkholderia sp. A1RI-2L]|uniref:hypothetical protein n=1 Tax=Paraburkholderia sp. A1RI-2L TaxID=3028367 RepID=UPI003B7C2377
MRSTMQDVENSSVALARETEGVQSLPHSADAYGEALSMAKSLYRTGSAGFLEVLVADRAQFAAQDPLKLMHMIRKGQMYDERDIKTAAEPN